MLVRCCTQSAEKFQVKFHFILFYISNLLLFKMCRKETTE